MSSAIEAEIQAAEDALKQAMLASNVDILERLLADDLIFTNHLGQQMSKQDDLEAHRSGAIAIEVVDLSDLTIKVLENVAIVTVAAWIVGQFAGNAFEETLKFTRVWQAVSPGHWQVIAAHASAVVN
ncbi:MAG: nuclear transport factor 2 family protein [Cyanobacteria bacterium P01_F01_bin.150]